MQKQTTLAQNAVDLLPSQFYDSDNLKLLISALVGETTGVQELEEVFWEIVTEKPLNVADGNRLDEIGEIVGCVRGALSDADFRTMIYAQISINCSHGLAEQLIYLCDVLSNPNFVESRDRPPACFQMYAHIPTTVEHLYRLQRAACAGVKIVAQASEDSNPFVFGYDADGLGGTYGSELSYGDGFGEYGDAVEGGCLTEIFEIGVY